LVGPKVPLQFAEGNVEGKTGVCAGFGLMVVKAGASDLDGGEAKKSNRKNGEEEKNHQSGNERKTTGQPPAVRKEPDAGLRSWMPHL